jgi:uncharacterized protein
MAMTFPASDAFRASDAFPASDLTTPQRYPERATYERSAAYEVLDGAYVAHLGFVVDGAPRVLPTLFVRLGERIYLHGSTASTPWQAARRDGGLPIVVEITALDGLVLARSQFHHSANYRSVVAHGLGRLVTDEATKRAAMTALVDKVAAILGASGTAIGESVPDELRRSTHTRPPTAAELAKTAVVALDLVDVSVKRRSGEPVDDDADLSLPYWAGVVPLSTQAGTATAAPGVTGPPPAYVPVASPWYEAAPMAGRYVTLEPLGGQHTPEFFRAFDDAEVWRHSTFRRPASEAEAAVLVDTAVADRARVAWLQRRVTTGEVVGTTSYHGIDEGRETLTIGATMVARPWWRTAVNTETKLLLLTRAFETLGAGRVEFHVDLGNERSQTAVTRLGATREGVLRRHKRRGDGSWRDSVIFAIIRDDWPAVRDRLADRLAAHGDRP